LEEELTSDEPHENINATTTTLNRQKQEKEEIINTAEILQEEGQRMLEDLSLVCRLSLCLFSSFSLKKFPEIGNVSTINARLVPQGLISFKGGGLFGSGGLFIFAKTQMIFDLYKTKL